MTDKETKEWFNMIYKENSKWFNAEDCRNAMTNYEDNAAREKVSFYTEKAYQLASQGETCCEVRLNPEHPVCVRMITFLKNLGYKITTNAMDYFVFSWKE